MRTMASQITSLTIVYSTIYSGADKKTLKLCVTGLCEGNSPVTGEFPAQRASNAENVSIRWRHHGVSRVPRSQRQNVKLREAKVKNLYGQAEFIHVNMYRKWNIKPWKCASPLFGMTHMSIYYLVTDSYQLDEGAPWVNRHLYMINITLHNKMFIDTSTITAYLTDTNKRSILYQSGLSQSWLYALYGANRYAWVNNLQTQTYKQINGQKQKYKRKQSEFLEQ